MKTYAGYFRDKARENSSSGGVFFAIASYYIHNNGIVYGVCMSDDNYSAKYKRITKKEELWQLQGSKYLQATLDRTFSKVKMDLLEGREVLFSGTACHINGLKSFLNANHPNLLCIDIICHGVPSKYLWNKYLRYREASIGKCVNVNFRSKKQGWYDSGVMENDFFIPQKDNIYMRLFLSNICLRPSCYECICKQKKQSDITLGDLWGVYSVAPEMNDDRGISTILVRTLKGEEVFLKISSSLEYKEIALQQALLDNPSEYASTPRPNKRNGFYRDLNRMSFKKLISKYLETSYFWKIFYKILRLQNKIQSIKRKNNEKI